MFSFVVLIAVIGFGAWRVVNEAITVGELVAFIFYLIQVVAPFFTLNLFVTDYQEAKGSIQRVMEIINEKDERSSLDKTRADISMFNEKENVKLSFEQISFSYDVDRTILEDVSFHDCT